MSNIDDRDHPMLRKISRLQLFSEKEKETAFTVKRRSISGARNP
jgi:hypothetical protein